MYVFTQNLHHGQDVTQGQFSSVQKTVNSKQGESIRKRNNNNNNNNNYYYYNNSNENNNNKLLWDFDMQTDHLTSARRPDLIIINKKKEN